MDRIAHHQDLQDLNKLVFPENPNQVYVFQQEKYKEEFDENEVLGTGKCTVKSFIYKPAKKIMAIKLIHIPHNRNNDETSERRLIELVREISNFKRLSNDPNIVTCYGVCLHQGQALICMEQMDFSLRELYLKIHETDHPVFPEELLGYIVISLIDALVACKRENVIHRDIKPENVLLNKKGEIKLADFGETRILHDSLASTFAGTICYWPPERFESEKSKYDVRADIWSLGITLIEITSGRIPYRDKKGNVPHNIILLQNLILQLDTEDLVKKIFPGDIFSEKTRKFVSLCLKRVDDRPKYDKLIETEFYKYFRIESNDDRNMKVQKYLAYYGLVDGQHIAQEPTHNLHENTEDFKESVPSVDSATQTLQAEVSTDDLNLM